jgi:hypothetical protein
MNESPSARTRYQFVPSILCLLRPALRCACATTRFRLAARLESGQFRNLEKRAELGKSLVIRSRFIDGQLNRRSRSRPVSMLRGNERNRGTSNPACIGTSDKVEVVGGFPGAKREASCFANGWDRGSIVSGLKSSSGGGIVRKTRPAVAFGMKGAKNEPTLSLSKRKLATKAKIAPPKATYASPRAVTISAVTACRPG